jgi:hypothetical protein
MNFVFSTEKSGEKLQGEFPPLQTEPKASREGYGGLVTPFAIHVAQIHDRFWLLNSEVFFGNL